MKNIIKKVSLFIFIGTLTLVQGCYDDFKEDFEYTATYFARQFPLRTLVEEDGKDMTFEIGAVLGGKYSNSTNEEVAFVLQDTFLNTDNYSEYTLLPSSYYTISSDKITIPSGKFQGAVNVTLNKEMFMEDNLAVGQNYALPVEMVSTTADSILTGKHYSIIVLRYYNKYHGWYYVKGTDTNTLDNSVVTYSEDDLVLNNDMLLETTSKNELAVPYVGNPDVSGRNMSFSITDGNVVILEGNVTGTSGTGTYDASTRNFALEYNYTDGNGDVHNVKEALIYRNTELVLEDWQ